MADGTDIDLTTNAGWDAASDLAASFNTSGSLPENTVLAAGESLTTAGAGVATFDELPIGLYYVTETATPAGVVPSDPFLVTIPMTDPTDLNAWMYDVYVYPKNDMVSVTKSVNDADDIKIGDTVEWTIAADVPDNKKQGENGAVSELTSYALQDTLDSRLNYASTGTVMVGSTELTKGTDYTLTEPVKTGGGTWKIEFTPAGIAKLAAAGATDQITVTISTTVNAVGEIPNTAVAFINGSGDDHKYTSNEVETKFGGIDLRKVAEGTETGLAGAQFQVFTSEADANAQTNPVAINGVSTWTTGDDGVLKIEGLRYSDWENGATDSTPRAYYLVEVKAPSGYELLAEPIEFQVTAQANDVADVTVENVEHNAGFELPLTGGSGTTWLTIGGLVILIAAGTLVVRNRRQAAQAAVAES